MSPAPTPAAPLRLAMWSGPRNLSTALLRSWGNRPDTFVCDEPLYAHYLHVTGLDHPVAQQVIASQPTDWREVAAWLTGPIPGNTGPGGKAIFYQKHMAHHLLPEIEPEWLDQLTNCFLIREPRAMLASLGKILEQPRLPDTGLPQQVALFRRERERTNRVPPVLLASDILQNPRGVLGRLCDELELPFLEEMLHWPPGRRETDGVWAPHWYGEVEKSTGFAPYQPREVDLPAELEDILAECEPLYAELAKHRITVE